MNKELIKLQTPELELIEKSKAEIIKTINI